MGMAKNQANRLVFRIFFVPVKNVSQAGVRYASNALGGPEAP